MRLWTGQGLKALADLKALAPGPRSAIREALGRLRAHDDDRPPGLDVKRLAGRAPFFRLRVGGYRVVFTRQQEAHRIMRIFHRSEGYGWLERFG